MSKRAANTLWHRADQIEMVKSNISRILWNWGEAPNEIQAAITHELEQLQNIIEAMQQDSRDERESGQRWYKEQVAREKVRQERERDEVRHIMREQKEAMEDQERALEQRERIRPTGPKRETML